MKGLSALERNKPASRTQLTLQRLQGISMLVFYPLEFISFFSAPFAPLLAPRWITFQQGGKAALWSIRAWLVYVLAQVALLIRERNAIAKREATEIEMKVVGADTDDDVEMTTEEKEALRASKERTNKRKEQIVYQLVANVSRLPVIFHWCVHCTRSASAKSRLTNVSLFVQTRSLEGGIYPYEVRP